MEQYVQSIIGALIPCAVFWGILAYSMHRDRSRYRNIVFLVLALAAVIPLLEALAGPGHKWVELAVGIFALYTIFLQIVPRRRDFDYVIVLGAGLLHGNQVSKLQCRKLEGAD